MKKINHATVCITFILFTVINIDIIAADPPSNIISNFNKSLHLDHWQIVKDTDPKLSLSNIPDSLWQLFEPALNLERYTEDELKYYFIIVNGYLS